MRIQRRRTADSISTDREEARPNVTPHVLGVITGATKEPKMSRRLTLAVAALVFAACGGKQVDTTIPIDAARVLNSEISSHYVRTRSLLEETTERVRAIDRVPPEVDVASIDTDLLRHVLEACFTEPAEFAPDADMNQTPRGALAELGPEHSPLTERPAVGRLEACNPARMLALETYLAVIDAPEVSYVTRAVLEVDALRANLKDVLVVQIDEVERMMGSAAVELVDLRGTAEERRALAQSADLTADERRRTEVDFETISQELDQVQDVLDQLDTDLSDWRRLRRQLVDEAASLISGLGSPE